MGQGNMGGPPPILQSWKETQENGTRASPAMIAQSKSLGKQGGPGGPHPDGPSLWSAWS